MPFVKAGNAASWTSQSRFRGTPLHLGARYLLLDRRRDRLGSVLTRAAMFDNLTKGLQKAWDIVRRDGRLTADNVKGPMREIRRALLEADVSLSVVRPFMKRVEEKALGVEVIKGVTPEIQLVKVVRDELVALMGSERMDLEVSVFGPQIVLLAGLQGVGKTTACAKLALLQQKNEKKVVVIAADVYRPAAVDQLMKLGQKVDVDVFALKGQTDPVVIVKRGVEHARQLEADVVIVDTAGRLQIDEEMMDELKEMKASVMPTDIMLVVDAMTGQEAAGLVRAFDEALGITGAILTKLDGDSRGGAALSVHEVSGKPIKFVGTGEKLEALEPFYPDRMAGRILGMGDLLTLYEQAEEKIKAEDAAETFRKLLKAKFDMNDFMKQYRTMTDLGGMGKLMKMIPGMADVSEKQIYALEKQYKAYEAIISSMTEQERLNPELLVSEPPRRRRIARGSGRSAYEVDSLLGNFMEMRGYMQNMSRVMALQSKGMPGIPVMSQEEMLDSMMESSVNRVPKGMVRRRINKFRQKKDKKGAQELQPVAR